LNVALAGDGGEQARSQSGVRGLGLRASKTRQTRVNGRYDASLPGARQAPHAAQPGNPEWLANRLPMPTSRGQLPCF